MNKRLSQAVAAGERDASVDRKREEKTRTSAEIARRNSVIEWRKWFEANCYKWVRFAVRKGMKQFSITTSPALYGGDFPAPRSLEETSVHDLWSAIREVDGFEASYVRRQMDLGKIGVPCLTAYYEVVVTWKA